ncbi:MAG TPA: FHA domain-containing protein [Planctomycetota bacterium]|nr:FHA domain-containing protein [Planctomycetota bacterium]
MPKVNVMKGDEVLLGFILSEKPVTLGRGHESDIHVPDKRLSRKHCRLELVGGDVVVTDLESTNGIFYKGARVKTVKLEAADEFFMGDVRVALEPEKLKLGTTSFMVPGEETFAGAAPQPDIDETGVFSGPISAHDAPTEPPAPPPRNLHEYARRIEQAAEDLALVYEDLSRTIGRDPRYIEIVKRLRRVTIELESLTQD